MPADWLTVADLLGKYDGTVAINVAYILGNSPVRIWGVGWNDRPATVAELEDMRAVVREAMEEGAWGLSTGLDYPPGEYADTDELVALSEESARYGGFYHTHTRGKLRAQGLLAPWHEALDIGRRSGIPVHLTHYRQGAQGVGSHLDYIGLVEDGRAEGLDVTFDCYSYPYSGTHFIISLPGWAKDGGPERVMAALKDPDDRARMKREVSTEGFGSMWLTNFTQPGNAAYEGRSISDVAEMRGQEPLDAIFDLLIEENLGVSVVSRGTNQHTLAAFVSHPYGMIASGRHPVRGVPQSAHLRLLPAGAGRVREGGEAPATAGGHTQDDLVPGAAARAARPWDTARRLQGRRRGVRPRHGEGARDAGGPEAVPGRHRVRDRQRAGGHRQGREHRRTSGPGAAPGPGIDLGDSLRRLSHPLASTP